MAYKSNKVKQWKEELKGIFDLSGRNPEATLEVMAKFIVSMRTADITAFKELVETSQWQCPEHGLPKYNLDKDFCLDCDEARGINVILVKLLFDLNKWK